MNDRRVHAANSKMEVVRYERAGKWYLEPVDPALPRQNVSVRDAAAYVLWWANQSDPMDHHEGLLGGSRFDALIKSRRKS